MTESSEAAAPHEIIAGFLRQVAGAVRQAQRLPSGDDYQYLDTFPEFRAARAQLQQQLVELTGRVHGLLRQSSTTAALHLQAAPPTELDWYQLRQLIASSLEEADNQLDLHRGVNRHKQAAGLAATAATVNGGGQLILGDPSRRQDRSQLRPQRRWKQLVDNSPGAFKPILRTKPHARAPLELRLLNGSSEVPGSGERARRPSGSSQLLQAHLSGLGVALAAQSEVEGGYEHPYRFEIENLVYQTHQVQGPPDNRSRLYNGLDRCSCSFVDTVEELSGLAETLAGVQEFAVDLEHHNQRSYLGFTCLMQISTREEDFIVDTLALRPHMGLLAAPFADPTITKVLHGANHDIQWLQRDFGIYVVNMFDTDQASRSLEFPKHSLAYLLQHFCQVQTDKSMQRADWRLRPLPPKMLQYARMDTHYLLYIYDRLRSLAVEQSRELRLPAVTLQCQPIAAPASSSSSSSSKKNDASALTMVQAPALIFNILERSQRVALIRYEKPAPATVQTAASLIQQHNLLYTDSKARTLQLLCEWRDRTARALDESASYVLPNYVMFAICDAMPADHEQLLRVLNVGRGGAGGGRGSSRHAVVVQHADKIVELVQKARLMPCSPLLRAASSLGGSLGGTTPEARSRRASLTPQLSGPLGELSLDESMPQGSLPPPIPGFDVAALSNAEFAPPYASFCSSSSSSSSSAPAVSTSPVQVSSIFTALAQGKQPPPAVTTTPVASNRSKSQKPQLQPQAVPDDRQNQVRPVHFSGRPRLFPDSWGFQGTAGRSAAAAHAEDEILVQTPRAVDRRSPKASKQKDEKWTLLPPPPPLPIIGNRVHQPLAADADQDHMQDDEDELRLPEPQEAEDPEQEMKEREQQERRERRHKDKARQKELPYVEGLPQSIRQRAQHKKNKTAAAAAAAGVAAPVGTILPQKRRAADAALNIGLARLHASIPSSRMVDGGEDALLRTGPKRNKKKQRQA